MQGERERVRGPTLLATGVGRLRVRTRQSVLAEEPSGPIAMMSIDVSVACSV